MGRKDIEEEEEERLVIILSQLHILALNIKLNIASYKLIINNSNNNNNNNNNNNRTF